jgi:hypothetical protein
LCLFNRILILCLPISGYDVSVERLCVEVHGGSGVSLDLHFDIWIIVHWFLTQIVSRSCNSVRRHNPEDQAAVLDHSEKLRSHTRCNVNLLRVNVIELCTVLCCFIAGEWASVARGGASFLQSRPRDLPAARRTIGHGTDCGKRDSEDPATGEHCWCARF